MRDMVYIPTTNKIYALDYSNNRIIKVDCATNTMTYFGISGIGSSLTYCSSNDSYFVALSGFDLKQFSVSSDTLLSTMFTVSSANDVIYSSTNDCVYAVMTSSTVRKYNSSGTLISNISIGLNGQKLTIDSNL